MKPQIVAAEFWDMQTSRMPTPVQWLDERARSKLDGEISGATESKVFVTRIGSRETQYGTTCETG